jgi:hypothetical protein
MYVCMYVCVYVCMCVCVGVWVGGWVGVFCDTGPTILVQRWKGYIEASVLLPYWAFLNSISTSGHRLLPSPRVWIPWTKMAGIE